MGHGGSAQETPQPPLGSRCKIFTGSPTPIAPQRELPDFWSRTELVAAAYAPHEAPDGRADRRGREPQTEQHARVRVPAREPARHQREAESEKDRLEGMHAAEGLRRRKDSASRPCRAARRDAIFRAPRTLAPISSMRIPTALSVA